MAKRTIQSCWKQYEKLVRNYLSSETPEITLAKMVDLTEKANGDKLGASLITLFVKPHLPLDLEIEFCCDLEEGEVPEWKTRYDSENSRILIHPISIIKFVDRIAKLEVPEIKGDAAEEEGEDFLHRRWVSFLRELSKLPSIYILFMLTLQRVAYLLEIAHLEKRGGIVEIAEGEAYHTMLWAFKELESFTKRTFGQQIRSHYGMSWYESEWITGR
jgi:hypothetical protein